MGIGRITNGMLSHQAVSHLNTNLSNLSMLQEKLASGKNILKASDDPVGLTRVLDLSNSIRTDEQFRKNIETALAEARTSDSAINNMVDIVHRAQELTTQAANFTNSQDGRTAIALEVDELINQLVQLGNTDIGGKYVFGGFVTDSPPYSRSGDDITYSGTPAGSTWQREVEISKGIETAINVIGKNLLGEVQVTTAGPPLPPAFSAGSSGLFKTMIELKQDLKASTAPNQLSEIRNRLDELTVNMNTLLNNQAILGSVSSRLSLTQTRLADRKAILTQEYSQLQDVDMPRLISSLQQQQNTFDASLSVTGKILQNSLLNYLR
jgi:flagellar hook-associated protein 3 FlgL